MRQMILLLLSTMVFSCHNDFHSPTDKEIEQAVMKMYEKRNENVGGGGWIVKDVKVIRSWKGNDERHYNAEVKIQGVHTSPPIANRRPDEDINETREIKLIWRGGQWIGVDE
ncbi:MAG TPA: hypothetical protein VI461_11775 [Chitinophagaceae bacterium]|nr:hypothetical protein [Chitinophagaceae bacterium]